MKLLTDGDRQALRDLHRVHVCGVCPAPGTCACCGSPWPCDVLTLLAIEEVTEAFTVTWTDRVSPMLLALTCAEAEALADLWRVSGKPEAAQEIIDCHAEGDPDEARKFHYEEEVTSDAAHS